MPACVFCELIAGNTPGHVVWADDDCVAFLDRRPLFPGHVLLCPRAHYETLVDLPPALIGPLFSRAQRIAQAVTQAMGAEGTFVAMNNRVSQSVPHLHVHVVPRTKGDGLRGFFWPRKPYADDAEMATTRDRLAAAIAALAD